MQAFVIYQGVNSKYVKSYIRKRISADLV